MTVYVSDTPYTDPAGQRFHLWAHTDEEAHAVLFCVGALDPAAQQRTNLTHWKPYWVTLEQFCAIVADGLAEVTDKWGPLEWVHGRYGNTDILQMIARSRLSKSALAR